MIYMGKNEAEFYSGDGATGMDYSIPDPDINFAVMKMNGRSPKVGYQVNTQCKELVYIMKGTGTLLQKGIADPIVFSEGDVILIENGEGYAFDGNFEACVPCTPAWTNEQHKYIN